MKEKRCELVRRELEELPLNEEFSTAAAAHLQSCADCREFHQQQLKLRQIVGSLGTVNAPPDFDFRLRARLAADSHASGFRYWSFAVKGLATAAILVVFGVGVAVIWQRSTPQPAVADATRTEPKKPDELKTPPPSAAEVTPTIAVNQEPKTLNEPKRKVERPVVVKAKHPLSAVEFSSERANVVSNAQPAVNNNAVFPIEASLQSLKVSLDDGRGNERTISFPTVSFGSQRVLTTANQFAPKGVW